MSSEWLHYSLFSQSLAQGHLGSLQFGDVTGKVYEYSWRGCCEPKCHLSVIDAREWGCLVRWELQVWFCRRRLKCLTNRAFHSHQLGVNDLPCFSFTSFLLTTLIICVCDGPWVHSVCGGQRTTLRVGYLLPPGLPGTELGSSGLHCHLAGPSPATPRSGCFPLSHFDRSIMMLNIYLFVPLFPNTSYSVAHFQFGALFFSP